MTEDEFAELQATLRRAFTAEQGFAADMREQGIHVGLGTPPVCVSCDKPWPCGGDT